MANVLSVSTSGDNFVWKSVGTQAEAYLTFDVYVPTATWGGGFIGELGLFTRNGDPYTTGVIEDGIRWENLPPATWDLDSGATVTTAASGLDTWHTVSVHWKQTLDYPSVQIDGVDYGPHSGTTYGDDIDGALFGAWGGGGSGTFYIRNIKIGTSGYGSSELFSEDFTGGTLANFTSTQGTVSVIADPTGGGGGPADPEGISIAFADGALEATPTWTQIDNVAHVSVQRWTVKRGRPTERDKTETGTATISGIDTNGVLDPTNATGAYYGNLDPVKQVAITLENPTDNSVSTIFRGFVADWNYELDASEHFLSFDLEAVDALDILADAEVIPDVAGNTVPSESTGDVYYDAQQVDDRIFAALADAALSAGVTEWPSGLMEIFSGNVAVRGTVYSPRTPILQVIDDAADAEFPGVANRYVSKTGEVTFHGRQARFDPTNPDYNIQTWNVGDEAAFAGDSTVAVISALRFTRGKTNLINAALATPNGIKDAEIAGQYVSDATSISTFGARSISFENLITQQGDETGTPDANTETLKYATYYVDNYKDPRTRVSQIVIHPHGRSGTRASNLWALACGIEISDIVHVKTTHVGGGGFDEDFYVEGITYEADTDGGVNFQNLTLTLDVSPKAYYDTNPGL